jgi:protein arginine kinase activator
MLCCVCKEKEATVHLTQIVGDKMQKVDLCKHCAEKKGVNDPTGFSLADLLLGLGASQEMEQASGGSDLKCPHCGFTQADFKKTGRLGCAGCYEVFGEGLEALLKSMHKGTRHVGKAPASHQQTRAMHRKLESLQADLAKAISEEDFEQAAQLRDEIKRLSDKPGETARANP